MLLWQADLELRHLGAERLLERTGLSRRRHRRPSSKGLLPTNRPRPIVEAPNDLWTVDFKGWWRTLDRKRCDAVGETLREPRSIGL